MIFHYALGDQWLQLDTAADHLCLVNSLAAEIVQLRQSGTDGEALVQTLLARYAVDEARLRADIDALLTGLTPPAEVVFKDPNGYVAEVSSVPYRAPRLVASTVLHLPGFMIHVDSESIAVVHQLERLFRLPPSAAPQVVSLHFRLLCENEACLIVYEGIIRDERIHGRATRGAVFRGSDTRDEPGPAECDPATGECLDTGHGTADTVMKCLRCFNLQCALALPRTCFIHAAAVAHGTRGLLLPARGGSGKSTLATSLVQRGDALINDDIVSLELATARLHPVPMSVSLKEGSWPVLASLWANEEPPPAHGHPPRRLRYWSPDDTQAGDTTTHCSLVVVPRYSPNTAGSELAPLSPEELLLELLEAGASLDRPLQPIQIEQLCRWLNSVSAWRLHYATLNHAHTAIDRLWKTLPEFDTG